MSRPAQFDYEVIVQVVNYRSVEFLQHCIDTVGRDLDNSQLRYCIKVADNDSGDDLSALKTTCQSKRAHLFDLEENRGFGAAHNFLFQQSPSESRFLLIVNPDITVVQPDTVLRLIACLDDHPEAAVAGPALQRGSRRQRWDHGELDGFMARLAALVGGSHYKRRDSPGYAAWVSGAVFLIRTERFREFNGFDERFFLFKEEEDLCLRLRRAGLRIWYEPAVIVHHEGGGSGAAKAQHLPSSMEYFSKKHLGRHNLIARVPVYVYAKLRLWD